MVQNYIDKESLIANLELWTTITEKPPLDEVQALRILDEVQQKKLTIHDTQKVSLYSILAFYRLKRNFDDDQLVERLLAEAGQLNVQPVVYQEIKHIKGFLNFYSELERLPLQSWAVRETDFAPAKLKKVKDLLEEMEQVLSYQLLKEGTPETKNGLNQLYDEIVQQAASLASMLGEAASALENRRTGIPVQKLNDKVREIISLENEFYENLPLQLKKNIKQDPLEMLDEMVGLKDIKQYIYQYYHYLKYQKERRALGFNIVDEPGLHMIISGNPGTGKTTIARLLAAIYHELGLLETNKVTEVNRSHLVGSYVGQSEENTINYVRQSLGGILFIDEAYSLKREGQSGNDYGQAVIDTLVSSMTSEEYADRFAVILAGYREEMRQFLWSNPGLRSRFPEQNHIVLPDFKAEELLQIAEQTALSNDYFFTDKALNKFQDLIEQSRVDESFGNARTVRDLVLKAIFKKGSSKKIHDTTNWLDHMRIEVEDLYFMDEQEKDEAPMEQLDQLIGLNNVKEEVKKLSSFVRVQQQRKQNGLPSVPVQLHAVFSGNPGTGKTTVANIYSRILNNCGLLKRGHLVVASRSDLVAGYVGQTAIKTKQKVREALGGVLFIDEAYSLYRGDKDFGKEAIDTLVDEMTKHKENLVVILAGYEREMEQFIASNPGLESRFKKYFHFENYQAEELLDITKYQVHHYRYEIDTEALSYLSEQYQEHKIDGNGRFVVNLVDEAVQYQALRMMEDGHSEQTALDQKLTKQDFLEAWTAIRGNKL